MKKLIVTISLCLIAVWQSGCATVMTGKYQSIPVTSEPQGIKVRADTGESIITPGKFHLIRNEGHTLVAECPGYEPQQLKLHNKAQGWVWGNILLGGVIGLIVDCSSGASDELIPKEVHFNFGNPQMTTREATKIENLSVKGIVYDKDKPAAIIGTQIVHEGDRISGATVVKITKNSVEFEMNGKKWTQNIQE